MRARRNRVEAAVPADGAHEGAIERAAGRPWRLPRKVCVAIIFVAAPLLVYLEFGKPTLTQDEVLAPLLNMVLTRGIGAVVFFALLLTEGYRVMNPVQKPFGRSLLFILPPLAVVVNNMPILSLLSGDAYLVHDEPVYLIVFALECIAIGLFEEAAFRGVILLMFAERRYRTRGGLLVSILLTSAVFGLVHLVNVLAGAGIGAVMQQIGYSFLIGAMCSVVLLKTRNIWLCVLLHAIYDFCGSLVPTLGDGHWWDTPTVVITVVLAVATTAYMVWQFLRLPLDEVARIYGEPEPAVRVSTSD